MIKDGLLPDALTKHNRLRLVLHLLAMSANGDTNREYEPVADANLLQIPILTWTLLVRAMSCAGGNDVSPFPAGTRA
jgi:hypothetical protein